MSQRRSLGGTRREATERVLVEADGFSAEAWTLNVSRGGLRVVLEDSVTVGSDYHVTIHDQPPRLCRVVWVRDENDGQIAGLQYLDVEGAEVPGSVRGTSLSTPQAQTRR